MDYQQPPYRYSPQHQQPPTANLSQNSIDRHHAQGYHNNNSTYSSNTANYSYPQAQAQAQGSQVGQVPAPRLAGTAPSTTSIFPSYVPPPPSTTSASISDSMSQSSYSGPPSPMNVNPIAVHPAPSMEGYAQYTVGVQPNANVNNGMPMTYQNQNHMPSNGHRYRPHSMLRTMDSSDNLHVPAADMSNGASWSGSNYDQSPYSGVAESFSPSSSSNNGASSTVAKKYTNACARCRRQKMKCTFKDNSPICTRCFLGSHKCVLEERKSRNPGELEIIRGRLRNTTSELDQAIDNLREVNTSQYETPLSFIPSRIPLTREQREELKDVLGNVGGTVGGRKIGVGVGGGGLDDVRALLMEEESDESDESGNESEGAEGEDGSESLDASEGSDTSSSQAKSQGQNETKKPNGKTRRKASHDKLARATRRQLSLSDNLKTDFLTPIGFVQQATSEAQADKNGYFQSSPLTNASLRSILIERGDEAPLILTHGLFTLKDVEVLFDLYFKRIHPIVALLDPAIHTPSSILLRSSFLFTVICTIACRFADGNDTLTSASDKKSASATPTAASQPTTTKSKSKKRSASMMDPIPTPNAKSKKSTTGLSSRYPIALHFAKVAAASALIDGRKNVEMVQAYLLMALYAPNGKRFEESRTLFYSGVASTVAVELGLHRISERCPADGKDERAAREWHNLIRTWIICFNLDRCYSVQYGKPLALKEDFHTYNKNWYKAPFANTYDVHLHGHTDALRIMSNFHQAIRAEKNAERIPLLIDTFQKEIDDLAVELKEVYLAEADMSDEGCCFRLKLAEFVTSYSRLLMFCHGLQQSFDNGVPPDPELLIKALQTATAALNAFVGKIASTGFWRYSPDCYFIYSGYCSTFLLKLIDSKFPYQFDELQKSRIVSLVRSLVDTLASPEVAIDEQHTPKLYAGFLEGLLKRVSSDVRSKKRMRVDREKENKVEKEKQESKSVSPPPRTPSVENATPPTSTVVSPISAIAETGPLGEVNESWTGTDYMNDQNALAAFPMSGPTPAAVVDTNGYYQPGYTNASNGMHLSMGMTHGSDVNVNGHMNGVWDSTTSLTHTNPNTGIGMTWDDVCAMPDYSAHATALNSYPTIPVPTPTNVNVNVSHTITNGHPMNIGNQWHFNGDDMTSPYNKWSMEDLVPTVSYLMPSA